MASTRTGTLSTTPLVMSEARAAQRAQSAVFGEAPEQSALFGPAAIEERLQSALFREALVAECAFP